MKTLAEQIEDIFNGKTFTLQEAYQAVPDKPKTTVRGRIYDNLGIKFEKVSKGIYQAIKGSSKCIVVEGNGRDLSMLDDNSIDCIITDHPWEDNKSNTGGDRKFADSYSCFKYNLNDFKEKARVLKQGHFLIEILPAENENNYEYLYQIKEMAKQCGLLYYSKVPWKKGNFVSNTGRKAKNTEDIMIFSKGKPRAMRIDAKKTKQLGETQYMSGTNKMLPTMFDVEAVNKNNKIHQSEKPTELYHQILEYVTNEYELVLDQFAGSGSVGEACLNKNRNCILIEILKDNINSIVNRLGATLIN